MLPKFVYNHQKKSVLLTSILLSAYVLQYNGLAIDHYSETADREMFMHSEDVFHMRSVLLNQTEPQNVTTIPAAQNGVISISNISDTQIFHADNTTRQDHFVYVHTEYAQSSTLSNIFSSYGYRHSLNMMMATGGFSEIDTTEMEPGLGWRVGPDENNVHILEQHARYNHAFFQKHFPPNTVYITSIMEPVAWYIRAVNSFKLYGVMNINEVLEDDTKFHGERGFTIAGLNFYIHNSFLDHLGFEIYSSKDLTAVKDYIDFIDKQFNLVMISEYFDESLVLLKRLMNWSMADIFYSDSQDVLRPERLHNKTIIQATLSEKERRKLLDTDHNFGDWLLYQHFNASLWKKIAAQPQFFEEVAEFKSLNREVQEFCRSKNSKYTQLSLRRSHHGEKPIQIKDSDCLAIRVYNGKATELSEALDEYCPFRKGAGPWMRRQGNSMKHHPMMRNQRQRAEKMLLQRRRFIKS